MLKRDAIAMVHELEDAVNAHDVETLLNFYAENAATVSPVYGEVFGRAAISKSWETIFSLFPDWMVKVSDVLLDGDRVAFMGMASATDRNGWFGQAPTQTRIEYRAVILLTISNGKIVRDERIYDLTAVMQCLEKAQLDKELSMAAEVQRALWSRTERGNGFCEAAGDSLPCRSIGGDFFEMHSLTSGDCAIALGDASGKGPPAAILAAMIQGMLAAEIESRCSPSAMLSRINRRLSHRGIEPRFATLVLGILSPDGRFIYSNAGHNPPILLAGDHIQRLETGGRILGAFAESLFEQETVALSEGDTIVLFSDGVTEALNSQQQEFGEDRLISYVSTNKSLPATDLVEGLLESVTDFAGGAPRTDDTSVTVVRYTRAHRRISPVRRCEDVTE